MVIRISSEHSTKMVPYNKLRTGLPISRDDIRVDLPTSRDGRSSRSTATTLLWILLWMVLAVVMVAVFAYGLVQMNQLRERIDESEHTTEQLWKAMSDMHPQAQDQDHLRRKRSTNMLPTTRGAAHLVSYINTTRPHRHEEEKIIRVGNKTLGVLSNVGFLIEGLVYSMFRMDKPDDLQSSTVLNYTRGDDHATVVSDGLYFLYVHITYWIKSVTAGYTVTINNEEFVRCVTSQRVPSMHQRHLKTQAPAPCSINAAVYLRAGDTIQISSLYRRRHILPGERYSFWGLVKMG